ncbi:MAG: LysR family transcriptional regulator [Polynucleobacter sp.]|nr:LysR family transcriptional regulator [Polynucleobacter sp.]
MSQYGVPNISSEELQAFLVVAQYQSFVAAAITLNMSQPALTRLIQNLEKQLHVSLFKRTTRAVQITPEGRELVAISERLLNDLRIGTKRIQDISQEERGLIIISTVMSVAHASLAKVISEFHKIYPNVEIHIREGVHGIVLDEIRSGAADIGITYIEGLPDSVKVSKLGKESFHIIFKKNHRLSKKSSVKLSDLENEDLISLPWNSRMRISCDSAASLIGLRLNYVVTVGQFGTMLQFVRNGIGIALVPEGILNQVDRSLVESRPITSPKFIRELGIISLGERQLSKYASDFSSLLKMNLKLK